MNMKEKRQRRVQLHIRNDARNQRETIARHIYKQVQNYFPKRDERLKADHIN